MSVMSEVDLERWERNSDEDYEESRTENIAEEEPQGVPAEEEDSLSDILASIRQAQTGVDEQSQKVQTSDAEKTEEQRRTDHDAAEAKRKAEWENTQRIKKEQEAAALVEINAMSDDDAIAASAKRAGEQTEKLTRRNMKICVTDVIQAECRKDSAFARLVLSPKKSMARCFHYINRRAKKFIQDEMKETGEEVIGGGLGGDVPDDIVYEWAIEYFKDANAEEDKEPEEKFVPKPFVSSSKGTKKKDKKPAEKKKAEKPKVQSVDSGQICFGAMEAA